MSIIELISIEKCLTKFDTAMTSWIKGTFKRSEIPNPAEPVMIISNSTSLPS